MRSLVAEKIGQIELCVGEGSVNMSSLSLEMDGDLSRETEAHIFFVNKDKFNLKCSNAYIELGQELKKVKLSNNSLFRNYWDLSNRNVIEIEIVKYLGRILKEILSLKESSFFDDLLKKDITIYIDNIVDIYDDNSILLHYTFDIEGYESFIVDKYDIEGLTGADLFFRMFKEEDLDREDDEIPYK